VIEVADENPKTAYMRQYRALNPHVRARAYRTERVRRRALTKLAKAYPEEFQRLLKEEYQRLLKEEYQADTETKD
jgi:hypothetical protein